MTDNTLFRKYELTLTTLTPLNVGNGRTMQEGIDYLQHNGYAWIANEDALFNYMLTRLAGGTDRLNDAVAKLAGINLSDMVKNGWLPTDQINLSSGLFRYALKGQVPGRSGRFELREFIKDVYGNPYIPGSTIKGAMRSAVLRSQARSADKNPVINYDPQHPQRPNPKKEKADDLEERKHFVPNTTIRRSQEPNYSLWRTLKISDTPPAEGGLVLASTYLFHKNPNKEDMVAMAFEAIPAGREFSCPMWIEDWLLNDTRCEERLKFTSPARNPFVSNMIDILREDSRKRLIDDHDYFCSLANSHTKQSQKEKLLGILRSIAVLEKEFTALNPNETMLQIGRGTGWRSKAMGDVLVERLPSQEFSKMVQEFKLGRGYWQQNGPIPFTHLLAQTPKGNLAPMGWVRIAIDEA